MISLLLDYIAVGVGGGKGNSQVQLTSPLLTAWAQMMPITLDSSFVLCNPYLELPQSNKYDKKIGLKFLFPFVRKKTGNIKLESYSIFILFSHYTWNLAAYKAFSDII